MGAADVLREAAQDFELEAARAGEHVSDDVTVPAPLVFAIQQAIYAGMAIVLHAMANVEEEREAA